MKKINLFLLLITIAVGGFFVLQRSKNTETESGDKSHSNIPSSNIKSSEISKSAVDASPGITVAVLEQGSTPHQKLRMKFRTGEVQNVKMGMKMNMEMSFGETHVPAVIMPWYYMPMTFSVEKVDPEGKADVKVAFGEAEIEEAESVDQATLDGLRQSFAFLKGMTCNVSISSRGIPANFKCNVPEGTPPQIEQMTEQMQSGMNYNYVFLPEEPIGLGAKWTMKMKNTQLGIVASDIEAKYSLEEIAGDTMKIGVSMTYSSAPQKIEMPGGGPAAQLNYLKGEGSGSMALDINKITPTSELDTSLKQEMFVNNAQDSNQAAQTLIMEMKMKMKIF